MKKINAFIPAAGFGERLRPITDHIPKPLLPILGKPIIEIVLNRLSCLSPDITGINIHHCRQQMQAWAENSLYAGEIRLFHENTILGTGGALRNAESLLEDSPVIVHNSDILTDINLEELVNTHNKSGNVATLAVHGNERFNNVWIDKKGHVQHVGKDIGAETSGLCKIAFIGIAVYSPGILDFLPVGGSSIVDAWRKAISRGYVIGTLDYSGSAWTDIGTPHAYASAVFDALKKEGETVYIHESVKCSGIELGGNAVIEQGTTIEGHGYVENSIFLPASTLPHGSRMKNCLAGPGFSISLAGDQLFEPASVTSPLLTGFSPPGERIDAFLIGTGGSDRTYYRTAGTARSIILMKCADADQDFFRHIAYSRFFRKYSLPIPEILMVNEQNKEALFEDLGDLTLYSWFKCRRSPDQTEDMYRKVLDALAILHTTITDHVSECPLLQGRVFDYSHLKWETEYFLERFVRRTMGLTVGKSTDLENDLDGLAKTVDAFAKTIVHRDFQSQNIMIPGDSLPRLIDYQGARMGPPAYDVSSMLWDPYKRIEPAMRERLLDYYLSRIRNFRNDFDETAFRHSILPCRLQRHMQALGAYGYLSEVKGKRYFLKYVPQALAYLKEEADMAREEYPSLCSLIKRLS